MSNEQIPISEIDSLFYERVSYDEDSLKELAANLQAVGYNIDPVILRPLKDKLQVVKGTRVYKAAMIAKFTELKAEIREMDDTEALQIALSDNIFNEELSKIDQAKMLLMWQNTGVNGSTIAKRLGKSKSWVSQTLKLLDTDASTQEAIAKSEITAEHAVEIAKLPSAKQREAMTTKVKDDGMSVKETRKGVDKSIARMDLDHKKETLEKDITEYRDKVESAITGSETITATEKRMAELEVDRKKLAKGITDEDIKAKAFSLEIVEKSINPAKAKIEGAESEIEVMKEQLVDINLETAQADLIKLEKKRITAANAVESAKAKLEDANKKYQVVLDTMKPIQASINDHGTLSKSINTKETTLMGQRKNLEKLVEGHEDVANNYKSLREEVDKYSADSEKVAATSEEYGKLAATIPSLRGNVANKGRYEDVLARKESELIAIEELIKA